MILLDIWTNYPDAPIARVISDALVARRLAACANLYPKIEQA